MIARAVAVLGGFAVALGMVRHGVEAFAATKPSDFSVFWMAARMAAAGEAVAAYERSVFLEAMRAAFDAPAAPLLVWLNPPVFLLPLLPLALLSHGWAWLVWTIGGMALLGTAAWRIMPNWFAVFAVMAAPAAHINLGLGQNGFVTAGLLAWFLVLANERPLLAGMCLGLLAFKPQLGLVFPLLLAASGRWRCFAAATAAVVALVAVSMLLFGIEPWRAFLAGLGGTAEFALYPPPGATLKLQSVQVSLLRAGVDPTIAWISHGAVAGIAILLALHFWRRAGAVEARAAATLAAAFLTTPYVFPYDAVALAVAGLFLMRAALVEGQGIALDATVIMVACALPLLPVALDVYLALPMAWLLVLGLVMRRTFRDGQRAGAVLP